MKTSRIVRMIIFFIILAPIAIFIFGQLVMFLWNNALVPVLHVSEVTFWQGLGILVLARILFSSFGGKGGSNRYYRKQQVMWNQMTPEQKERFREEWRKRSRRWGGKWETDQSPGEEAAGQI